mgnify:CR=1 FL=1
MKAEIRKVVILDTEDKDIAKAALKAALSVKDHEVLSNEEGDAKMDTIIHFLNSIIDNFD